MLESNKNKRFIRTMLISILLLIILWSLSFHISEWWSYIDSLYFTIITFSTIWYWDIAPITNLWKILAMIYAILWVPLFIWALSIIIESRMKTFIINHFGHHVKKIEKEEIKIEKKLAQEQKDIKNIEKEVENIEKKFSKKEDSLPKKIIKKIFFRK